MEVSSTSAYSGVQSLQQQSSSLLASSAAAQSVSTKKEQTPQSTQKQIEEQTKSSDVESMKKQLQQLTSELNKAMDPLSTNIKFGFNDKIEEMFVSVIEAKTDKVIRKMPSDEAMTLMSKMRELVGMIFDKKA